MNRVRRWVIGTMMLTIALPLQAFGADDQSIRFFESITKQDLAAVRAALEAQPNLASAKDASERSAVTAAVFLRSGPTFIAPAENQILHVILAKRPTMTFLEACLVGDVDQVRAQLDKDPSLAMSWNANGFSALHCAAFSGHVETARALLEHHAMVNARSKSRFKNTPLQIATLVAHYDMAKFLLENDADVLVRQVKGFAPLHEAAFHGRQDLVELLLEHGAEIDARNNDGETALTYAMRGKHTELAEYLRAKGASTAEIQAGVTAAPKE